MDPVAMNLDSPENSPATPMNLQRSQTLKLRIGSYTIGETIGLGTFGKVKKAEHVLTGKTVAVKILNRLKIKSMSMDQKIRREIQILKLFKHPHIIKLYEVIETPTDVFMFMEFVSGGELFDMIVSRGRLPEAEARKFFQQIIYGVEYCHVHNVVHRDLKPENLLLDGSGHVKLADFGLSNIMSDGDFLTTSCGSPNYAAPEVISGQMYSGQETDIWSCGVILYALVVGKLPFDEDYIPTLFQKIRNGIYTMPKFLSYGISTLIRKFLLVNPIQRITIPEVKEDEWFCEDLPEYLGFSVPSADGGIGNVFHPAVVELLAEKMECSEEAVEANLRSLEANDFVVAYRLIMDNNPQYQREYEEMIKGDVVLPNESDKSLEDAFLSLATSPPMNLRETDNLIPAFLSKSVPVNFNRLTSGPMRMDIDGSDNTFGSLRSGMAERPKASEKSKKLWDLGILTNKSPADVMRECYRVLQLCDYEWRMYTKYHIGVRPVVQRKQSMSKRRRSFLRVVEKDDETGEETVSRRPELVRFHIQLYMVNTKQCLLDFKKITDGGDVMGFLVTMHTLISCFNL